MIRPLVTILVPHYKTLELTKLCLRLIRKFTDLDKAKIVVIDNDSRDNSLTYLRSLTWIHLIERQAIPGESPGQSHSRALDLALKTVTTPYVLSIHTDTLVKHPRWLAFLIEQIEQNHLIGGVGSWKLESKSLWRLMLKAIERYMQFIYYRLQGKQHGIAGKGKNYYYLRSHCALYRMDLLKKFNLHFSDGEMVAGKGMHFQLVKHGYQMIFLPSETLIKYLDHVNHATTVLNPDLSRRQDVSKDIRRIEKSLAAINANAILADASLDQ